MDIWLVVSWFVLALVSGYIAHRKNRIEVEWFFYGLGFGPLATCVLAILPKLSARHEKEEV